MAVSPVEDMFISPGHLAELNYKGWSTAWLYIIPDPNEGCVKQVGNFMEKSDAKYIALCWEKSVSKGRPILVVFMVFKSIRSENSLKTKHGLNAGILLAKSRQSVPLGLVVQWMKGNFYFEGKLKPANSTFQEMRQPDYIMRGRESDPEFLEAVVVK